MNAEEEAGMAEAPERAVRQATFEEILPFRGAFAAESRRQITRYSLSLRPGWTREYLLLRTGMAVGFASVAVDGPWKNSPALYQFHLQPEERPGAFSYYAELLRVAGPQEVLCQSNDPLLTALLLSTCRDIRTESVLFEDAGDPGLPAPVGTCFRRVEAEERPAMEAVGLESDAPWVLARGSEIVGAGGYLTHYNPPYADIYMAVVETARGQGMGRYLVQQLKVACRAAGFVPAARCAVDNLASRRTLCAAGFAPCGVLLAGLPTSGS